MPPQTPQQQQQGSTDSSIESSSLTDDESQQYDDKKLEDDDFPTTPLQKLSLWAMPPSHVHRRLKADIIQFAHRPGASGVVFEPHITLVGGIPCDSMQQAHQLAETLQCAINKNLNLQGRCHHTAITCTFDKISRMKKDNNDNDDDEYVWNQACCWVMERTTTEFDQLVRVCRQALRLDQPQNTTTTTNTTSNKYAPPLEKPHLSLYYGPHNAPEPQEPSLFNTDDGDDNKKNSFDIERLELWSTSPSSTHLDVSKWKRLAVIALPTSNVEKS